MAIIGTLPITLTNGSTADATQVMSDFNFIVNQVNANATALGTLTAPTGTSMNFFNATAPTGWAINAAVTDHTVWLNAGSGGTTGGAANYSTMFQAAWTSDGHALSTAELAVHNHPDAGHAHGYSDPAHAHTAPTGNGYWGFPTSGGILVGNGGAGVATLQNFASTNASGVGITIQTSFANNASAGSGAAHSHTKTFNAKYIAAVVAIKS